MDRLSDHRFVANNFRLYLHAPAMNLLGGPRGRLAPAPRPWRIPRFTAERKNTSQGPGASMRSGARCWWST
jgi:hypothetical protein